MAGMGPSYPLALFTDFTGSGFSADRPDLLAPDVCRKARETVGLYSGGCDGRNKETGSRNRLDEHPRFGSASVHPR